MSHHSNFNMEHWQIDDGIRAYKWDALNRLKVVHKMAGDVLIGQYDYDARNRRIRKVVSNGGLSGSIPNDTTDFVYNSDWQCVEERDGSNDPTKQYVWGIYIDELIQQRNAPHGTPADYYPLQDLLYRTTALTDDSGDIIEAYDCDAYGNTLIFEVPGTASNWWADDAQQTDQPTCDFIFTGRRYDAESKLYQYRHRYYDPDLGRFFGRGSHFPIEPATYQYVQSSPLDSKDPFGLREFLDAEGKVWVGPNRTIVGNPSDVRAYLEGAHPFQCLLYHTQ